MSSFFLSTVKHSRDLRAHKIKIIKTVKRVMTRGSSGIKGHLVHFLSPSPKLKKVIPKKICYILLYFRNQKPPKNSLCFRKQKPLKASYISENVTF